MKIVHLALCCSLILLLNACLLSRPDSPATRLLEPELTNPEPASPADDALQLRIALIESREHINHELLRQRDGDLQRDPIWRWTTTPDRYLYDAIEAQAACDPNIAIYDRPNIHTLHGELTRFDLASSSDQQSAVLEATLRITLPDHRVIRRRVTSKVALAGNESEAIEAAFGKALHTLAQAVIEAVATAK